jgi:excisionase family DNA binding protein
MMRLESAPELLTVTEAAKLLRIGRTSAYEALRCGRIPGVRIGRRVLVPKVVLQDMIAEAALIGRSAGSEALAVAAEAIHEGVR